MPLTLIATPIGHPRDIGARALELLRSADCVIGEEHRPLERLLATWKISPKEKRLLNEHTQPSDLDELLELCQTKVVVYVSDAGTPGFCDPGPQLVAACRNAGVKVTTVPGPSSLMGLLSLSGHRINQFFFVGFLPVAREERAAALQALAHDSRPLVIMDTPYRLERTLTDLARNFPDRDVLFAGDLTSADEFVFEGPWQELLQALPRPKMEFILLIHSAKNANTVTTPIKKHRKTPQEGSPRPRNKRRSQDHRFRSGFRDKNSKR